MRDKLWLFIVVGKAALITTLVGFALVLGVLASKIVITHGEEEILGGTLMIFPAGIAAWWMFRKLQAHCTRREARAAATAVAVFTPVSLGIAMLLSQISGGTADQVLGSPFGLIGAFAGIVVITTLVNYALSLFTLWVTRHAVKLESTS